MIDDDDGGGELGAVLAGLMTISQAAALAGVCPMTVRRAVDAGAIAGARGPGGVGRLVRRESVRAWARARAERLAA